MLSLFCLRLAFGLLAALVPLVSWPLNPRFYRTHFLTALGLAALALVVGWSSTDGPFRTALGMGMGLAFLGSASWSIEGNPGGRSLIVLACAALGAGLILGPLRPVSSELAAYAVVWRLADDFSSAILLGVATTAMLLGHSYLIAPNLSLSPLKRMLIALLVALALRAVASGAVVGLWTAWHSLANLTGEALMWLPLRWGLGFMLPIVLTVMAWKTVQLRNTQSATGILYIVVVFCFLGELTSQLLASTTAYFV